MKETTTATEGEANRESGHSERLPLIPHSTPCVCLSVTGIPPKETMERGLQLQPKIVSRETEATPADKQQGILSWFHPLPLPHFHTSGGV